MNHSSSFSWKVNEWHITIALWVNSKQSFSCFFLLDRKLFWSAGDSTHQVSHQVKLEALSFRCEAKCFEKLLSPNNGGASTPESASQSDAHLRVLGNEVWGKAYISKCIRRLIHSEGPVKVVCCYGNTSFSPISALYVELSVKSTHLVTLSN